MKLYRYYEECGRMGSIEGLLFLTDEQKKRYQENELHWDELLGKHSSGTYDFSDDNLEEIKLPEETKKVLHDVLGSVISGPFDLDYFDEQINERDEYDE